MICPLCNCDAHKVLTNKLRSGEIRQVFYCQKCELGILDDSKNESEIKEYYEKHYRKEFKPNVNSDTNPEDLFNTYVNFQGERIQLIEPYLSKDKVLLEIGSSAGMFLYHIREKVRETIGIDFDINSAKYAADKCNCKIYTDEIQNIPLKKKSIDIMCSFQTLEHVKSPINFLLQIKEYLKDDGMLFVEVPNLNDVLLSTFDLPNHRQFYFHNAHLYYFTVKSLNLLLDITGFTGQTYFTQDYNILNHFNWVLNDRPQMSCIPGLALPSFPMRKGGEENIKIQLSSFLKVIDKEYKSLLARLGLTSNLSFIGHKRNE